MQSHVSATFRSLDCAGGVCVVDGYGVQVRVCNRCLIVSDGVGRFRRERSFAKALVGIKRLIIVSHEGAITLEALRWLTDAGIAFLQIDRDGEVIVASANYGLNDPRLRRALSLAPFNSTGLEIGRFLLCVKLAGQEMALSRPEFPENARGALSGIVEGARNAPTFRELLQFEAAGALAYWSAWQNVGLRFAKKAEKSLPQHWCIFGQRSSQLTGSPRLATNPANALLNYLYALLEAEGRFACLACGLDPGLGVFHADQKSRDSLVLDVMEAVRPQVDTYLLDLLATRTFSAKDFVETRKGVCRVLAPLTHTLAETTSQWGRALAPVVENVAALLAESTPSRFAVPTPLTQAKRSAGRDGVRRNPKRARPVQPQLVATCETCGGSLPSPDRQFCDDCLPGERKRLNTKFLAASAAGLAKMHAEGRNPMYSEEGRRKLGEANARRCREAAEWDRTHERPDPEIFTLEILPMLQSATLPQMRAATGLSLTMCANIRRGYVPHPRHWDSLRILRELDHS
jgi:CRISPR-associated endonuclease Cas1